jgi:hypothetical protein
MRYPRSYILQHPQKNVKLRPAITRIKKKKMLREKGKINGKQLTDNRISNLKISICLRYVVAVSVVF